MRCNGLAGLTGGPVGLLQSGTPRGSLCMGLARLNRRLGGLAIVPCVFLHRCNLSEKKCGASENDTQNVLVIVWESNMPLKYGPFLYLS